MTAVGLRSIPGQRPCLVRIIGRELPGAACGPYTDVHVALAVGKEVHNVVLADVPEVIWETEVRVGEKDGVRTFHGKAVEGKAPERFLYLNWSGRLGAAPHAGFRRAKLRLDLVPQGVLEAALSSGVLVGTVGLTDPKGMPLCASVKPPVIGWAAGQPTRAST